MSFASAVVAVARREVAAYVRAPIAYVVGILFLVLQGFSFWAIVGVLADPARPAPLGAVIAELFGGSVVFWAVLFLVVATVSMRLIAEEKSTGSWELLCTAPVSEAAIVIGKWLGALVFYAALWAPTLLYLVVLSRYAPPEASFDPGPVAAAYAGVLLLGASMLAIGAAASAATSNQIIAAVVTFAALVLALVAGQLPELAPGLVGDAPNLARLLELVDLRGQLAAFARGAPSLGVIVFHVAVAVTALAAAAWLSLAGRRRPAVLRVRAAATALIAINAALACAVVARHPVVWDVTRAGTNSLDAHTQRVLRGIDAPVDIVVLRPTVELFDEVYDEVDRLLDRMVRAQPRLSRRDVDPNLEPERLARLAEELAVATESLVEGGAVIFSLGERRRAVDLRDMVRFGADELGVTSVTAVRAEDAFAEALAELTGRDRPAICFTSGHGELPLEAAELRHDLAALAAGLSREGMRVSDVGTVAGGVPAHCRALAVIGPLRPLDGDEALAVARYLDGGGALLVAPSGTVVFEGGRRSLPRTGLELVLADYGIRLPQAIVIDPRGAIELPGAWITTDGYGDHPIVAPFAHRGRLTVWRRPRPVLTEGDALVRSSMAGWGETDLAVAPGDPASAGAGDVLGPVPVAAASARGEARVVVLGSASSLASDLVARGSAIDQLVIAATAWLTRSLVDLDVGAKTPERLRLIMTPAQLRGVFVFCVVVIPLVFALAGGLLWWRRRRGA